jgi:hypothetical protein
LKVVSLDAAVCVIEIKSLPFWGVKR